MEPRRDATLRTMSMLVLAVVLAATVSSASVARGQTPTSLLRVVHAASDAPSLDVYLDGLLVAQGLAPGAATAYAAVAAGDHHLTALEAGGPTVPVFEALVSLAPGGAQTVVVAGLMAGDPPRAVYAFTDDGAEAAPAMARLRLLHVAPGQPPLEFTTADGRVLAPSLAYGTAVIVPLDAGTHALRARPSGGTAALVEGEVTLQPGEAATLVVLGSGRDGGSAGFLLLPHARTAVAAATAVPSSATAGSVAASASAAAPGTVLVSETFSDPAAGVLPDGAAVPPPLVGGYVEGEYLLRNLDVATRTLALPGEYADASIAVDVRLTSDTARRTVSVGCRFVSTPTGNTGYRLRVEPARGVFRLVREDGQRDTFLQRDRSSPAIRRDAATNRLELTCVGSTITAAINGTVVAAVQDSTYRSGPLVIGVGSRDANLVAEARFDNLVVTQR